MLCMYLPAQLTCCGAVSWSAMYAGGGAVKAAPGCTATRVPLRRGNGIEERVLVLPDKPGQQGRPWERARGRAGLARPREPPGWPLSLTKLIAYCCGATHLLGRFSRKLSDILCGRARYPLLPCPAASDQEAK